MATTTAGGAAARRLARSGAFSLVRRCFPVPTDAASAAADCQLPSRSAALIPSFSSSSSRIAPAACPSSFPAANADGGGNALRRGTTLQWNSHPRTSDVGISVGRSFLSSSASQTPPPPPNSTPRPPLPPPPPPPHRENPPDATNPDPVTLQDQWRYATRMYSTWYAHAWGTAILAGLSFFALGWVVKGENPLQFGSSEKKEEVALKPE